jgi:hypothetical protein
MIQLITDFHFIIFQRGVADPQEYPKNLEDLMDRKFAFRVKWQPGWGGQATVSLCKDSTELICKIQEHLPAAEVVDTTTF